MCSSTHRPGLGRHDESFGGHCSHARQWPLRACCGLLVAILLLMPGGMLADEPMALVQSPPMDRLRLHDGRELKGMALDSSGGLLDFLEIKLPPGKPTFAVIQTIKQQDVALLEKIEEPDRRDLARLVDVIRNRTQIRANAEGMIELRRTERGVPGSDESWEYRGDQFVLFCALDESTTRRFCVAADQIFQAYQHWLPPRLEPEKPIEIILFGSRAAYASHLRRIGLDIENPAVFVPRQNQVLIGTQLQPFLDRLKIVEQQAASDLAQLKAQEKALPEQLNVKAAELKNLGYSQEAVAAELQLQREFFRREMDRFQDRITVTRRKNQAALEKLIEEAKRDLCHELFHAYNENFLYPHQDFRVPTWLNEGLAQLFEHAHFENGTFRIDQAPPALLEQLQARLKRDEAFDLQIVLNSGQEGFLLLDNLHRSSLDYDVAWGLVWFAVFERNLFAAGKLDRYVHRHGQAEPALTHTFGQSLPRLQADWTSYILQLRP